MSANRSGPMCKIAGFITLFLFVVAVAISFEMTFPWSCWAQVDKLLEMPGKIGVDPRSGVTPDDTPDIFGPGKVSTVGNMWVKTTNIGVIGNPFTAVSSDPSAQWPGASGVEHLFFVGLFVGAKDATVSDPALLRRVSQNTEWRPPSLGPEDRIYQSFDGQVNGNRLSDDDGDGMIDEDRLDGFDNDGDGGDR